jgi:putative membrane protein
MRFLTRWVITGLAVFAAAKIVPGISVESNGWVVYAVMALILSLVNTFLRPILKFLSCPMILLTLGIFLMVINGLTFWLASYLADIWFHVGFVVDGFWPAFWGALIVSVVSIIFNLILKDDKAS